tara:strand:- start:583 stop:789 length:207 start_codon:yes stop_codon:yes gene_type:complete
MADDVMVKYGAGGVPYIGKHSDTPVDTEHKDWRDTPSAELLSDLADLDAESFTEKYGVNKTTVKKGEA